MAHTNISAISRRYNNDFATVVLAWAARVRTVDVSLSGQGGLLMCVSVCAAVLAQALFYINCQTYCINALRFSLSSLFIALDRQSYITFQIWSHTNLLLVMFKYLY